MAHSKKEEHKRGLFKTQDSKHGIPEMLCLSRITLAVVGWTSGAHMLTFKPMCTDT